MPRCTPRATAHVAEMLVLIQRLLDRGFAYVDSAGQVYFSVDAFPAYGALSGKVLDELEAGARVAVREEKRDPNDFALWKVDDKHLMTWDPHSPAGWADGDYDRLQALLAAESIPAIDAQLRPATAHSRSRRSTTSTQSSTYSTAARARAWSPAARSMRRSPRGPGPGDDKLAAPLDAAAITRAVAPRQAAKAARDFARADAIREALQRAGVLLEDLAQGVRWKLLE